MNNRSYFKGFEYELKALDIYIDIDRNGFFSVLSNKKDFSRLLTEEPSGLLHILNYDLMRLNDNLYRVIRRLESFSIEELEEEYLRELMEDDLK